jgi:hypothetical protein
MFRRKHIYLNLVLLCALLLALTARADDGSEPYALRAGDTRAQVVAYLGEPSGVLKQANEVSLVYNGRGTVYMRNGIVTRVYLRSHQWPQMFARVLVSWETGCTNCSLIQWRITTADGRQKEGAWDWHGKIPFLGTFMNTNGTLTLSPSGTSVRVEVPFRLGQVYGPCTYWYSDKELWRISDYDGETWKRKEASAFHWTTNGEWYVLWDMSLSQSSVSSWEFTTSGGEKHTGSWQYDRLPFGRLFSETNGEFTLFSSNQMAVVRFSCAAGELHGPCRRWWSESDKVRTEGEYEHGTPVGRWPFWLKDGTRAGFQVFKRVARP